MKAGQPFVYARIHSASRFALLGIGLALLATPAVAQTPFSFSGNVVIQGGGTDATVWRYTSGTISEGSGTVTIALSEAHPTVVIRGPKQFGGACARGSDCWNSDICADRVCGWSGTEVASQCGDANQLRALDQTFDDCVRLWAVDSPSSLATRANECMKAGSKLYGSGAIVSASCPQLQQYRDGYDLLFSDPSRNVLLKTLRKGVTITIDESIADSAKDAGRVAQIKDVLQVIDSWFRAKIARIGTAQDDGLFAQTSEAAGTFWKGVFVDQVVGSQLPPVSGADASVIAQKIQRSGFVADRQVLRAAFDPDMPIQTAPFLLIMADAIQGVAERTENFAALQDIACRFRPCYPGRTTLGNYMKVLASVARDKSTLAAAIAQGNTTPYGGDPDTRIEPEWKPVFDLIANQHAALENAVLSARDQTSGYTPATLESDDLTTVPKYAGPLASIVRGTLAMSTAFESTGTLRPRPRQIVFGVDEARSEKIRAQVDELCQDPAGAIPTSLRNYEANEREYITSALAVAQGQTTATKAAVQLAALAARYSDLSSDMNGLRATKQAEEMRFGDFMRSFQDLAPAITAQAQRIAVSSGQKDIDLSAANARFTPSSGRPIDILQVAVYAGGSPWKLTRDLGDLVNFTFSGRWAPTCALRDVAGPGGQRIRVTDSGGGDILTGPEGYSTTRSGSSTFAKSTSYASGTEKYTNDRMTIEGCAGFQILGFGPRQCIIYETGNRRWDRNEYSSVSGGSSANTFSWGQGIRSDETPFPREPVGSLLLVELPAGRTSLAEVRSVQILSYPQSSIAVGGSSDFYLVVNDKQCSPVSASRLGVRVVEMVSQGNLARAMAQAMAEAQGSLRSIASSYVDQGRLLPGQRDVLRSQALSRLYQLSGVVSLSSYAESLRNLFDAFVNKQIADIEREIELVNIERQMKALASEEDAIGLDMAVAETSGRVASVLGGLALRNLDLTQLESKTAQVADLVRDWMEPVVNIRLAGDLTFTSSDKVTLDRLISLSPGAKYVDNLKAACPAVSLLSDKLRNDQRANPVPVVRSVIISVPDPDSSSTKPAYREVDTATARRIWTALKAGGDLELTVTPAMFYENREPFALTCSLSAPVVRSMAYYLSYPSLSADGPFNSQTTTVFPDMLFPRSQELFAYTFLNGFYLKPQVDILTGGSQCSKRTCIDGIIGNEGSYWQTPAGTSLSNKGTSPFATYRVDLSRLRNTYALPDGTLADTYPFRRAVALLVAFQVEAISQAPATVLPGVPPCQQ